ncbi:MAG: hypothetical protein M3389_07020 [Actinomycetota bacterium]|nr:hypothetical protein [Actinomycetota bacterium]
MRDHASEAELRVFVLGVLGAEERRSFLRRRRTRRADPEPEPVMVATTRATVIRGHPVGEEEARAWLQEPAGLVEPELAIVNRILHLHRVATADPYVREVALEQALVVRVGYGAGEQVADGKWAEAVEVPRQPERVKREAALRPQERLAALLGGRDAALACEELAIRARADVDAGRVREAALQLRVALEAAIAELEAWSGTRDLAARLDELRGEREVVGAAANEALRGGLSDATVAEVERVLGRVEAAIRARAAGDPTP